MVQMIGKRYTYRVTYFQVNGLNKPVGSIKDNCSISFSFYHLDKTQVLV